LYRAPSRVVRVTLGVEGVEGVAIIGAERQLLGDAARQIRVRNKIAAERDEIGVALRHDVLGALGLESARRDDPALEGPAKLLRRDRPSIFADDDIALYARLDDVELGQAETIERVGDVGEQGIRIAVRHTVPTA
jgi:hypothetical protein